LIPRAGLVLDQLEWADHLVAQNRDRFYNQAGFYVSLLREDVPVPADFEISRVRQIREVARAERIQRETLMSDLRVAYDQYCSAERVTSAARGG
jgi:hypothetical protein